MVISGRGECWDIRAGQRLHPWPKNIVTSHTFHTILLVIQLRHNYTSLYTNTLVKGHTILPRPVDYPNRNQEKETVKHRTSRSLTWDLARFDHRSVLHGSPDGTGLRPTVTAVNIVNLNKYKYGNKRLVLRYTSFKPRVLISGNHLDGQNWRSRDSTGVITCRFQGFYGWSEAPR